VDPEKGSQAETGASWPCYYSCLGATTPAAASYGASKQSNRSQHDTQPLTSENELFRSLSEKQAHHTFIRKTKDWSS
jgi:hypothetical protein